MLTRRRDGLREFGLVFSAVANQREGASYAAPARHLESAIAGVDDSLAETIADAKAPFWQMVREAAAHQAKE